MCDGAALPAAAKATEAFIASRSFSGASPPAMRALSRVADAVRERAILPGKSVSSVAQPPNDDRNRPRVASRVGATRKLAGAKSDRVVLERERNAGSAGFAR